MSYDPRKGENPYLGLEAEDETSTELLDERGDAPRSATEAAPAPAPATRRVKPSDRTTRKAPEDRTVRRAPENRVKRRTPEDRPVRRNPADKTSQMAPATVHRPQPRRGVVPRPGSTSTIRRGTSAAGRRPEVPVDQRRRVVPSPPQPPRTRRSGPFAALASLGLRVLSLCARLAAIATSLLVIVASFGANRHRAVVVSLITRASALIPAGLQGRLVIETPFGGAFRGDLAVLAGALFLIDWICLSYAYSLANGRERGA